MNKGTTIHFSRIVVPIFRTSPVDLDEIRVFASDGCYRRTVPEDVAALFSSRE